MPLEPNIAAAMLGAVEKTKEHGLGIIAGRDSYPLLLAQSARAQGVRRIVAVAFHGETSRAMTRLVDEIAWVRVGRLQRTLDALKASGVRHAVMAGQIAPRLLFRARPDGRLLRLLASLPQWNAHTIFPAIANELASINIELLPAWRFMETTMPAAGRLSERAPTEAEQADVALGMAVAKATSSLEIGQTVVVKQGVILAVEAFEGTDQAIIRAGRLGGPGAVVVQVAKTGRDMRFDIPIVGLRTLKILAKVRASLLAVEASRSILLDREALVKQANRLNLSLIAVCGDPAPIAQAPGHAASNSETCVVTGKKS